MATAFGDTLSIVSLAFSIVSLVAVFSACGKVFKVWRTAKCMEQEYQTLLWKLINQKERLLFWYDTVGFRDPACWQRTFMPHIREMDRILDSCCMDRLLVTDPEIALLDLKGRDRALLSAYSTIEVKPGLFSRIKWSFYWKNVLQHSIVTSRDLADRLYDPFLELEENFKENSHLRIEANSFSRASGTENTKKQNLRRMLKYRGLPYLPQETIRSLVESFLRELKSCRNDSMMIVFTGRCFNAQSQHGCNTARFGQTVFGSEYDFSHASPDEFESALSTYSLAKEQTSDDTPHTVIYCSLCIRTIQTAAQICDKYSSEDHKYIIRPDRRFIATCCKPDDGTARMSSILDELKNAPPGSYGYPKLAPFLDVSWMKKTAERSSTIGSTIDDCASDDLSSTSISRIIAMGEIILPELLTRTFRLSEPLEETQIWQVSIPPISGRRKKRPNPCKYYIPNDYRHLTSIPP